MPLKFRRGTLRPKSLAPIPSATVSKVRTKGCPRESYNLVLVDPDRGHLSLIERDNIELWSNMAELLIKLL